MTLYLAALWVAVNAVVFGAGLIRRESRGY